MDVWASKSGLMIAMVGMVCAVQHEGRKYTLLVQFSRRFNEDVLRKDIFGDTWRFTPYLHHKASCYRLSLEQQNEAQVQHARFYFGILVTKPIFRRFSIWGGNAPFHQYMDAEAHYCMVKDTLWREGGNYFPEDAFEEVDLVDGEIATTQEIDWSDDDVNNSDYEPDHDDNHPMD